MNKYIFFNNIVSQIHIYTVIPIHFTRNTTRFHVKFDATLSDILLSIKDKK